MKKLGTVTFFAGAGFLDLGFENEGFESLLVDEFNPKFMEAYKYSREKMSIPVPRFGHFENSVDDFLDKSSDAAKALKQCMASSKDSHLIGFVGGPPCPDFSVAGKNKGHEGDRGRLTKSYFDLISLYRPHWFFFENVKGLWRTKLHREFYDRMKAQAGEHYIISDRLINSIEYGAPQDRDRIIMLGFRKDVAASGKLGSFPWEKEMTYPKDAAFKLNWPTTAPFGSDLKKPRHIPAELTISHWFTSNSVDKHPNAGHVFKARQGLSRFLNVDEGDDSKKSFKRLHRWRYSPTAAYGNNEVHLHPTEPRRITVAEALAIQTLPKTFQLPSTMTLSNMFKTIGNGVPYLAAKGIAKTIKSHLKGAL